MRKLIVVLALAMAGCGGSSKSGTGGNGSAGGSSSAADMTMVDLWGPASTCGHPGDKGNNVGVGQYCMSVNDCPQTAPVCTDAENFLEPANAQTYFCTITCTSGDNSKCGDNASCICQTIGCACVPTSCGTTAPVVDMAP
ncbi:MAG TPA: hypothetical protein VIA18_25795 [Polyangia bacterium]|jgi:hypothetical protein|nr:hypothetical protein [Polyangia bacterium]